jgi:hypothetical protein
MPRHAAGRGLLPREAALKTHTGTVWFGSFQPQDSEQERDFDESQALGTKLVPSGNVAVILMYKKAGVAECC